MAFFGILKKENYVARFTYIEIMSGKTEIDPSEMETAIFDDINIIRIYFF
jgi:ribosome-interacting GTPase 1